MRNLIHKLVPFGVFVAIGIALAACAPGIGAIKGVIAQNEVRTSTSGQQSPQEQISPIVALDGALPPGPPPLVETVRVTDDELEKDDPDTGFYCRSIVSPTRYAETTYRWKDWSIVIVNDMERVCSHVKFERKGVLQHLVAGDEGYLFSVFDSEDMVDAESEGSRPPQAADALTWVGNDGAPTDLVVEDLTGTGGATVVLNIWTGGNHVQRQISFFHLKEQGRVNWWGPYSTAGELTSTSVVDGDVQFGLGDSQFLGWRCCMSSSAFPAVKVSLKGGDIQTVNASLAAAELEGATKPVDIADDWAGLTLRNNILDLLYHGHVEEAKSVLRAAAFEPEETFGDSAEDLAKAKREWWSDLVREFRGSDFAPLLVKEFPALKDLSEELD